MEDGVAFPKEIVALAASVGGEPIAFCYGELTVTIVMRDGRKLKFDRGDLAPRPPLPMGEGEPAKVTARKRMAPVANAAGVPDAGVRAARARRKDV